MVQLDGIAIRPLLVHSTLVGLTPLVPVPFVDDMVKDRLQRRLVRELADASRLALIEADVRVLADDPSRPWLKDAAKSAALAPLRFMLKKTFVVLQGTRMVDVASECFHRGYLIDRTFRNRWCAPAGPHAARVVRTAVDEVCREVPTKPLAHAFRTAFAQSKTALGTLAEAIRRRADRGEAAVAEETWNGEAAAAENPAVIDVVRRLQVAIANAPDEHFRALDDRLAARLAAPTA